VPGNDVSDLMALPIPELTNDELASLRVVLNGRIKGLPRITADLSDETWREAVLKEEAAAIPRDMERFLDEQATMAKALRRLTAERDSSGADEVIGFIADGGLEKNARAAMVTKREYATLLRRYVDVSPDQVVDVLIGFYSTLALALQNAGVAA
jgi:uncharacterized protein YbjQ (UPF0145 family)